MDNSIVEFFEYEIQDDDLYNAIYDFLSSPHIREGKFEGNEVLLNKLNRQAVIVYKEYEMENGSYKYSQNAIIYDIPSLLKKLKEYRKLVER
jgi:hypothetical protein